MICHLCGNVVNFAFKNKILTNRTVDETTLVIVRDNKYLWC